MTRIFLRLLAAMIWSTMGETTMPPLRVTEATTSGRSRCAVRNWQADRGCSRRIHWLRFATTIQRLGVFIAPTALPEDPATLQQILRAALAEIERLRLLIGRN
jgi:hypothetical protein